MQPLVSIVLCTYNRRKLLPRAVKSVLSQTHQNWELVLIDDGSTDGSGDFLSSYARIEPRIRYRWQPNRGLAMARNAAGGGGIALPRHAAVEIDAEQDQQDEGDQLTHATARPCAPG